MYTINNNIIYIYSCVSGTDPENRFNADRKNAQSQPSD